MKNAWARNSQTKINFASTKDVTNQMKLPNVQCVWIESKCVYVCVCVCVRVCVYLCVCVCV